MAWYLIVLMIVGYLFIGGLIAAAANHFDNDFQDSLAPVIVVFWPILLAAGAFIGCTLFFRDVAKWVFEGIFSIIENWIYSIRAKRRRKELFKNSNLQSSGLIDPSLLLDDIDYVRRS